MTSQQDPARPAGPDAQPGVPAAFEKALRVLEAVAAPGGPHRLAEITSQAGLAKSTTHRLAGLLSAQGYLVALPGGRYHVGPALRAFAAQVTADTADGALPRLRDLQAVAGGHTVHLALRTGDHAVYVYKVDADRPYQMASRVGMQIPLHSSAIGKAILAQLPSEEVDQIVERVGLPRRTPRTITDRGQLHAELALVRQRGYAMDDEENEESIRCVGVPLTDHDGRALGGISISTVIFVTPAQELVGYVPALSAAARSIAHVLL